MQSHALLLSGSGAKGYRCCRKREKCAKTCQEHKVSSGLLMLREIEVVKEVILVPAVTRGCIWSMSADSLLRVE